MRGEVHSVVVVAAVADEGLTELADVLGRI